MTTLARKVSGDDHVMGRADAPVTLVEYGDFECEFCGRAYPIVKSLQRTLGDRMRLVFRHFPLREAHAHAQHAAEASEAASALGGNRAFWAMHDQLFEHQDALEDDELLQYAAIIGLDARAVDEALSEETYAPQVRASFRSGVRSGVNGTPTFFINDERYDGSWMNEREFAAALTDAASAATATPTPGLHVPARPSSEGRAET